MTVLESGLCTWGSGETSVEGHHQRRLDAVYGWWRPWLVVPHRVVLLDPVWGVWFPTKPHCLNLPPFNPPSTRMQSLTWNHLATPTRLRSNAWPQHESGSRPLFLHVQRMGRAIADGGVPLLRLAFSTAALETSASGRLDPSRPVGALGVSTLPGLLGGSGQETGNLRLSPAPDEISASAARANVGERRRGGCPPGRSCRLLSGTNVPGCNQVVRFANNATARRASFGVNVHRRTTWRQSPDHSPGATPAAEDALGLELSP